MKTIKKGLKEPTWIVVVQGAKKPEFFGFCHKSKAKSFMQLMVKAGENVAIAQAPKTKKGA